MRILFSIVFLGLFAAGCSGNATTGEPTAKKEAKRIVSLSGSITEVLYALNAQKEIVAVDVTSTYPAAAEKLTNVGHVRGVTAESIIGVKPTHVLAFEDEVNPALKKQLEVAGLEVILFKHEFSVAGTKTMITEIAGWLDREAGAEKLNAQIDKDLASLTSLKSSPKVLFVYARGTGNLMVAGDNTQLATIIKLAGGKNATGGFEDFKPLTAEAVVAANPDAILMFESGVQSLTSEGGVLAVPGVSATNAGKNKQVISMDGQLLSGFGPRVGKAIVELNKSFSKIKV